MKKPNKDLFARFGVLAVSGIALGLSFPQAGLHLLAWVAVVPLLFAVWNANGRDAFRFGMVYGFAYFAASLYWIEYSVRVYGMLPWFISVGAVALLCLILSLYIGIFAYLFMRAYRTTQLPAVLIAPVFWVTLDIVRTYFLSGFPWASIGYSQYKCLAIIQIADMTGVYGVTFLLLAFNGMIFDALVYRRRKREAPLFSSIPTIAGSVALGVVLMFVLVYGFVRLRQQTWGDRLTVSVAQGNIDQSDKWDPDRGNMIMYTYYDLTRTLAARKPALIVWPEASVPFIFNYHKALTRELREFVASVNTPVLLGAVEAVSPESDSKADPKSDEDRQLANSAVLIGADGKVSASYRKMHMVPFGEYIPWGLPVRKLVPLVGDFLPGDEYRIMKIGDVPFGVVICYEIIFPELVREFAARGAQFLTTVTNDAWFGRTSAPYQHFSMAVFRAVENRLPVVRAANTGISGFIDDKGRVIRASGIYDKEALTETITTCKGGVSFYTKFGNVFGYFCIVGAIMLTVLKGDVRRWRK